MKNLFLTGPMGSGKSTAIASALGEALASAGGFLTLRQRDDTGKAVSFWLQRPDGTQRQAFISSCGDTYTMHPEVFDSFGIRLLEEAKQYDFVILDEIGGFEVLSDPFMQALQALLQSPIPCIGVVKGEGPAGKMLRALSLADAYTVKAQALRQWLRQDRQTLLYECGRFDPEGARLAREWVSRHL